MSIRNYNAFLKAAKRAEGITHREAQQLYRTIKSREGITPTGSFVKAHPRITARNVRSAVREVRARDRAANETRIAEITRRRELTLEEWEEFQEEADEYESDEYTGAFDTGKGKKK